MESKYDGMIRKMAVRFAEFDDVTPIYRISFVLNDSEESFADFYGKTFSINECRWLKDIEKQAEQNDKDIEEKISSLYKKIKGLFGDDVAKTLKMEKIFTQFHGEDHVKMYKHENAIYCETAEQAFENFKRYYQLALNPESYETEGDKHFDEFLQSSLFDHIKNL